MKDERLARRAAEGDQKAFAAIYKRYSQDLYRFCLSIVRDSQDAQDALQSTMVKALRALPGETRNIQLRPWLYRVAHNEAVEVLRRRREGVKLDPELAVAPGEPSEAAATRERLRHLLDDLGELPGRQRSALVMRELAGLGFDEIGAALETSEGAARQAVYEARLGLRQMEAGREMRCKDVMWDLSLADGRVMRRREIQAHLRTCPECRAFRDEIAQRRDDFAALTPLPLAASAALLQGLLGGGAGAGASAGGVAVGTGGGSLAGGAAIGFGKSAVLKAAATVAVVAAGVTAADRGGLVEVPLSSDNGGAQVSAPAPRPSDPAGGPDQGDPGTQEKRDRDDQSGAGGTGAASENRRAGRARGASPGDEPDAVTTNGKGHSGSPPGQTKGNGSRGGGSTTAAENKKGAGSNAGGKGQSKAPVAKAVGKPPAPPKGAAPPASKGKPAMEPPSVQESEVEPDKGADAPFQSPKPEKGASP